VKQQPWAQKKRVALAMRSEHVRVGAREGVGRGLFATKAFAAGDAVTAYRGRVISGDELTALFQADKARFDHVNEYIVATPSGGFLYPDDLAAPGAHLINHSCGPNAKWGEWEHGALIVRAVKPIAEGEEITVHYGWIGVKAAKEKSWHTCKCGAPCCAGTIELRVEWVDDETDLDAGGPLLSEEEVGMRFLADIVNDTDEHETLVRTYQRDSHKATPGATILQGIDPETFFEKLRAAAEAAVYAALHTEIGAKRKSDRRLRQIMMRYGARGQR
jgi:hypothetical protein